MLMNRSRVAQEKVTLQATEVTQLSVLAAFKLFNQLLRGTKI